MARKKLKVGRDHVQKQAQASPLAAIEELIWNGLDAGGQLVEVRLFENELHGVRRVEVEDRGSGISPDEVDSAFGTIGESTKLKRQTTPEGRLLHGREGRGRFKALALCSAPVWHTTFKRKGKLSTYSIMFRRADPEYYETGTSHSAKQKRTGTTVILDNIDHGHNALRSDDVQRKLTEKFAYYLTKYPNTSVVYDGRRLAAQDVIARRETIEIGSEDAVHGPATLTLIEWRFRPETKKLHICSDNGFSFHEVPVGVQARGIEFTAYLCTPRASRWADQNRFVLGDLDGEINGLVELARDHVRQYVRTRLAEQATSVVEEWKTLEIYPYSDVEPTDPLAKAEREMFNIVAMEVNEQHPTFENTDLQNKKLTLALIKHALEVNPSSLTKILRDVVALPKEDQDSLAELLERAPLSNLIRAASLVAERLDTVQAFDHILHDKDWKKRLLERTQLHRLLVHELWLFGDEYAIGADDDGLRDVLRKHVKLLGREALAPDVDVKLIDGKDGIPDLMLYRRRKVDGGLFEHLVVELKRPRDPVGSEELTQIEKYALTVAKDERFDTRNCRWQFVLMATALDDFAKARVSQQGMPEGCMHRAGNVTVWVRTWADLLGEARGRYEFFRDALSIEASREKGFQGLQERYEHLLVGRGARKAKDLELSASRDTGAAVIAHKKARIARS